MWYGCNVSSFGTDPMCKFFSTAILLTYVLISSISSHLVLCQHSDHISHIEFANSECCNNNVDKNPGRQSTFTEECPDDCGECKDDPVSLEKSVASDNKSMFQLDTALCINLAGVNQQYSYSKITMLVVPCSSSGQVFRRIALLC